MKNNIFILILPLLLCGCSTTYLILEPSVRNPDTKTQFTDHILNKKVTVEFKDGNEFEAIRFEIGRDSCDWIDPNTNLKISHRTKDIKRVLKRNHLLGTVEGFGIGIGEGSVAGGILGFLLATIFVDGSSGGGGAEDARGMGASVGIVGGAIIGSIVGTVKGALSGHRYEYEFIWCPDESSLDSK